MNSPTLFNENNPQNKTQPAKNNANVDFQLVLQNLETISRRLKLNEEKQTLLSRKFELLEQNLVNFERTTNQRISKISEQVHFLTKEINELKETISGILENLKNAADKSSVKKIEKYLELWNPVKFATIDDVKRIVNEKENVKMKKVLKDIGLK